MTTTIGTYQTLLQLRLHGEVETRLYAMGPPSLRIANITIMVTDRTAALSIAAVSLLATDVSRQLGPDRPSRPRLSTGVNQVASLLRLTGPQRLYDLEVQTAEESSDLCGHAFFTFAGIRIRLDDSDAAAALGRGFASLYREAGHTWARLPELGQIKQANRRRLAVKNRTRRSR